MWKKAKYFLKNLVISFVLLLLLIPMGAFGQNSSSKTPFFLEILKTSPLGPSAPILSKNPPPNCQPQLFNPKESVSLQHSPNVSLKKISLQGTFKLKIFEFKCASSVSYVLELLKGENRRALWTHVDSFNLSKDNQYLFLTNHLQRPSGQWEILYRMIQLSNNRKVTLPAKKDCVSLWGTWQGQLLMTHQDVNEQRTWKGGKTKICIWNPQGKLLHEMFAKLNWGAGANYYLYAQMGLLTKDPYVFYMMDYNFEDESCYLYLQDLKRRKRWQLVRLGKSKEVDCRLVFKVDFQNLTYTEHPSWKEGPGELYK